MTSTLLIRLCGPLQSWGTQSRFAYRDTGREPSKSGLIGLLCAALGKPRSEVAGDGFPTIAQLAGLRMGVRVDKPGVIITDFHTASNVAKAEGGVKETVLSRRQYLSDACFLAGLEGDRGLLVRLQDALRRPVWHLSLGRKSCVPALPLALPDREPDGPGLVDLDLASALLSVPVYRRGFAGDQVRFIIEEPGGGGDSRQDVPVSFTDREFISRTVRSSNIALEELKSCISPDLS